MTRTRPSMFVVPGLLAALTSCNQTTQQDIPNRVLDRPTDVALVCARVDCFDDDGDGEVDAGECKTTALPLDSCADDSSSCVSDVVYDQFGIYDEGYAHILGFIANSERNEISIFTQCSDELIDLDVDVPGYNFVPAGVLPTHIDSGDDGCRVVSSNLGSCDLTVLDGEGFAAFGLDIREGGLSNTVVEPSELVTTLIPQRYDVGEDRWVPLAARPGELEVVPTTLSTAPDNLLDSPDQDTAFECSPGQEGSVYVTFPSCGLVAEVDILTGHILQSVQLETQDDGTVEVVPTGSSPLCAVECPGQLAPDDPQPGVIAPSEFNPQAIELLVSRIDEEDEDPREEEQDRSLFVGGLGSDWLIELRIDVDGTWIDDQVQQLELPNASGVSRIRVSPVVEGREADSSDDLRFLYVITGDGSTRVIGRAPDPSDDAPIGTECDTQRDPATISTTDPSPMCRAAGEDDVERRALAQGPGIRAPNGADVTDWAFFEYGDATSGSESTNVPIVQQGTFALGTTTQGRLVYVMIDGARVLDEQTVETLTDEQDPAALMSVELAPHSFLPDPDLDPLPLVEDAVPPRTFPVDYDVARLLAPSLRLVDSAYLDDPLDPDSSLLDNHSEKDLLAADDDWRGSAPIYDNYAPRIAVHDYRSWVASDWELQWEGILVGTSSTGRVACDTPGWEGGTCRVEEPDDARIHDAAAKFCDAGVLPGDKLVILGCTEDDQCGTGRRCLRETAGGGESSGICVSEQAYDDSSQTLRNICAPFIRDACGEAYREYTITKAYQDELWIQAMDIPAQSRVNLVENEDGTFTPEEQVGAMICADEQPDTDCVTDADCGGLDHEGRLVSESGNEEFPWQCVEARCRRPCEDAQECMLRPLPGPTCFAEFVPYQVRLRNAFYVDGPFGTLDAVVADPTTGECERNEAIGLSPLLTSRIPLPPSSAADDPDWNAIPVCPDGNDVLPTDPNPCRVQASGDLFRTLSYDGTHVDALRYSTPSFSLILDLTSLEVLVAEIPSSDGTRWTGEFAPFRRSRIPRGYTQEFGLESGYTPRLANGALNSYALTLPVRLVPSPEPFAVYIVDASGPGTTSGIRGQVLRFLADTGSIDTTFDGVR